MMICRLLSVAMLTLAFVGFSTSVGQQKDEKKQEPKDEKKLSKTKDVALALEQGQGVQVLKRDDKGRILVCYIVGKARISTIFGEDRVNWTPEKPPREIAAPPTSTGSSRL